MKKHNSSIRSLTAPLMLAMSLCLHTSLAHAVPAAVTLQGRLLNGGLPVESANVEVVIRVASPVGTDCTLLEEKHTLNMTNSDGMMSVVIGKGTRTSNDESFQIQRVFTNSAGTYTGVVCGSGSTAYSPSADDNRNIFVSFVDNGTTVSFSAPFELQSVPYALEANTIAGKGPTDFLQVTSDSTQSKLNNLMAPTPYQSLQDLIAGTSTLYGKPSGSYSSALDMNNQRITAVAAPVATTDAVNKLYADTKLGTKSLDSATISALNNSTDTGKLLSWNGSSWTATALSPDNTKVSKSGDTMSGALAMGSNDITQAGFISQASGKYFQFGRLSAASETALVNTPLTSAYAGSTWYNTDTQELKYWNGSSVKTMSSSFPDQAPNQVFAGPLNGVNASPTFRQLSEDDLPQLTATAKVANSATSATSANTNDSIVARDASGNFSASAITALSATATNGFILKDSQTTPNSATLKAPAVVANSYVLKLPTDLPATSGYVLSSDMSGNMSWIARDSNAVAGVSSLSASRIWVGNISGVAAEVAVSGDISMTNAGVVNVSAIKGTTVSAQPTTTGQVLRYNGTSWTPNYISMADLRSTITGASSATSCNAGQTLTYTSITDSLVCSAIAISDSQITYASQTQKLFFASPASGAGAPVFRSIATTDLPTTGAGGAFVNGGNAFGVTSSFGSTDLQDVNVVTGGTTRMALKSDGKVGVGTTSPLSKLSVSFADSATSYGPTTAGQMLLTNSDTTTGNVAALGFGQDGTTAHAAVVVKNVSRTAGSRVTDMSFFTFNQALAPTITEKMKITGAGDVGIGVASPSTKLDVAGTVNASGFTVGGVPIGSSTSSYWNANGSSQLYYNTANVGLGTSTPSALLNLSQAGTTSGAPMLQLSTPANLSTDSSWIGMNNSRAMLGYEGTRGAGVVAAGGGKVLVFDTNGTSTTGSFEKMRIDTSGQVGIGTNAPQALLDINGDIRMKKNGSAPVVCNATYDGRIAVTSQYTMCICKGGASAWVKTIDGATSCQW
ncbi:MAG: hypothetical protein EOP06_01200 [Proteobacteria bacterium]|nr:MAG: hypothetical protein EOP06_01200 [Pseudomonadota bacterium]